MAENRCVAYRCEEDAARGKRLCLAHQRRLDQGGGLPIPGELFPGDPSGHGIFAVVDRDDNGVLCHECGQRLIRLGLHLRNHNISVETYRQRHGIPTSESLAMPPAADGLPRSRPHPCRRCTTILTTQRKLCPACSQRRQDNAHRRRHPELYPKAVKWRELADDEKTELLTAIPDTLSDLITRLQRDRVPSKTIAEILGCTPWWMSRYHPRPGWGGQDQEQPRR